MAIHKHLTARGDRREPGPLSLITDLLQGASCQLPTAGSQAARAPRASPTGRSGTGTPEGPSQPQAPELGLADGGSPPSAFKNHVLLEHGRARLSVLSRAASRAQQSQETRRPMESDTSTAVAFPPHDVRPCTAVPTSGAAVSCSCERWLRIWETHPRTVRYE